MTEPRRADYLIRVSQQAARGTGACSDVAQSTWQGQHFKAVSRHGATMELARQFVAAGAPDGTWRSVGPDGRERLHGPSLHRLAKLTCVEKATGQRGFAKWEPHPRSDMPVLSPADDATGRSEPSPV